VLGVFLLLVTAVVPVYAQYEFGCVCSTNVPFATAPNNSHKIACRSEFVGGLPELDTVVLTIHSTDEVYVYLSGDAGRTWRGPILSYPGHNPGIAWGRDGDRHLVWEMTDSAGVKNIFYRNLELRMMPLNVSQSTSTCGNPDVCADSNGVVHIVWTEPVSGLGKVFYRTCQNGQLLGERFLVSTGTGARCQLPAVEHFSDGLAVIWQEFDSTRSLPYRIVRRRQIGGVWQDEEMLVESNRVVSHPSLDFAEPGESFAAAWDQDAQGNLEVQFIGGNGGGYSTPGSSTAPVLAHLGTVWSYLFWEEDSAGRKDICYHRYYFMTGWTAGTVRRVFSIGEPVYAPNCFGDLLVWTQGENPPYKVMWASFGYPIPLMEDRKEEREDFRNGVTVLRRTVPLAMDAGGALINRNGQKVLMVKSGMNDISQLTPGVYFLATGAGVRKVVVLH